MRLETDQARQFKQLQDENGGRSGLVAELTPDDGNLPSSQTVEPRLESATEKGD
jgi:hypothetical protein